MSHFSSVQLLGCVWLFETPWTAVCQASLSITNSQRLLRLMSFESMMPSNYLILCCPLLLLPSILLRVFSNESVLPIRWPKVLKFHVVGLNCARLFATPWSLWAPLSMEFSRQQYLSYIYIYSLLTSISPYSSFLFPFLSMYIPFQYLHLMCM